MCLIIFAPSLSRARIRKDMLQRGFDSNPDGAGFAYFAGGKLRVVKAFDFDSFYKPFNEARKEIGAGPVLIHFRRSTCGSHNLVNTQPISIYRGKLVMAHNGVFSDLSHHKEDISDSVYLTRLIKRLGWQHPFTAGQRELLDVMCGSFSKLVFLDSRHRYTIVNEDAGEWVGGAWHSDKGRTYRDKAKPRARGGYYGSHAQGAYHGGYPGEDMEDEPDFNHPDPDQMTEAEWTRYVALLALKAKVTKNTYPERHAPPVIQGEYVKIGVPHQSPTRPNPTVKPSGSLATRHAERIKTFERTVIKGLTDLTPHAKTRAPKIALPEGPNPMDTANEAALRAVHAT